MAKTKAQIIAEAQVVKNATEVGENTATRVGGVLEDLADADSVVTIPVTGTSSGGNITLSSNPFTQVQTAVNAGQHAIVRVSVGNDVVDFSMNTYSDSVPTYIGVSKFLQQEFQMACTASGTVINLINTSNTFSTGESVPNVGIDAVPTQGSNNLVKSGGVFTYIKSLFQSEDVQVGGFADGYFNTNAATLPPTRNSLANCKSAKLSVAEGDVYKIYGTGANNNYYRLYALYDANGNRVDRYASSGSYSTTPLELTIPSGVATMVVNLTSYNSATDKLMTEGEPYTPEMMQQEIESANSQIEAANARMDESFRKIIEVSISTKSNTHVYFPMTNGDTYEIQNNNAVTISLYLRKQQSSTGQRLVTISANTKVSVTVEDDYSYLYIYTSSSSETIYSISILDSKSLQYKVTEIESDIENVETSLSEQEQSLSSANEKISDLDADVIINRQVELANTSDSNVVLKTPIVLSTDGDSLEVAVHTTTMFGVSCYKFSNNGVNAYGTAVGIAQNRVSVRALDNTWIADAVVATGTDIKVLIEYKDGKIYVYVDDVIFKTYDGQKDVKIASFGNGCNDHWGGTIKYVKVNGSLLNFSEQTLNNVTLTKEYRFAEKEDVDANPSGVLQYNSSGNYFVYYSKLGQSNKYAAFKVELNVDDSDLVYLKEWRLSNAKLCEFSGGTFTEKSEILYDAENEMAMHFSGTIDYTGGIHGDERIDVSADSFVKFFAGGKLITSDDMAADFSIRCSSFTYCQFSTLHETSETSGEFVADHPIVATHYKRNEFKDGASHLTNIVKMVGAQAVSVFHAGMVCVGKGAGKYAIMPMAVQTPELSGADTSYGASSSLPARVDFWNPTTGVMASVEGNFVKGYNNESDIPLTSGASGFTIWDRTTDSKYYRRTRSTKSFADGDEIINTQDIVFKWGDVVSE